MIRDHQLYAPTVDELNDAKEGALKFPKGSTPHNRANIVAGTGDWVKQIDCLSK